LLQINDSNRQQRKRILRLQDRIKEAAEQAATTRIAEVRNAEAQWEEARRREAEVARKQETEAAKQRAKEKMQQRIAEQMRRRAEKARLWPMACSRRMITVADVLLTGCCCLRQSCLPVLVRIRCVV
jgi:uncharacterized membrane protein YdbT with pleckstrin-like domain